MAGPISSGIGLLSGLPTQDIIDQLMAIEARPIQLLNNRIQTVQTQRTALAELSARLLSLRNTVARFDEISFFRASKATSSDENVLTATAGDGAVQGLFGFRVKSLVSNHQLISDGFVDADQQAVGAGTLTYELGSGHLDRETSLDRLNGGEGVRRGSIEIQDSDGGTAVIDLSTTLTVADVLREINAVVDLRVSARVEGDHLVIKDEGTGTGTLRVREVGDGHTAEDLGILGSAAGAGSSVVGGRIIYLADDTPLSQLNDGNGVSVGKANKDIDIMFGARTLNVGLRGLLSIGVADQQHTGTRFEVLNHGKGVRQGTFTITNRAGQSADIVVDDSVQSIGDVIRLVNDSGIEVTASVGGAAGQLTLRDASTPATEDAVLMVEDVEGFAAGDLGIAGKSEGESLTGSVIYRVNTIGDVLRAINYSYSTDANGQVQLNDVVEARIADDGRGIELVSLGGGGEFTVGVGAEAVESQAARDLGLVGQSTGGAFAARDVLAGLNTVLLSTLRGGSGITLGQATLQAADGSSATIDFTGASTVQDIIDIVNARTAETKISARLNNAGTGLAFTDESGGTGTTTLQDVTGRTVGDLFGIEGTDGGIVNDFVDGGRSTGNLQLQYVALSTKLEDLNGGRGVATGEFRVTARSGQSTTISITENQKTVGALLTRINSLLFDGVEARINATGDGIEFIDTTEGEGPLKIEGLDGATTAADLNVEGEGVEFTTADGAVNQRIDGTYEVTIEIDAGDTLNDVRDKINNAGGDIQATVINDGSDTNPYHLVLNSQVSGTRGRLVLDTGQSGLSLDTLVRAQDAVVFFGGSTAENPLVLTSSTNTLSGVLDGVTIELTGTSDRPVDLSVTRDVDAIVEKLNNFVTAYNGVLTNIEKTTKFDAESNTRGPLFGDTTVNQVLNRLRNAVLRPVAGAEPGVNRLSSVGISVGSGGRLSFDEEAFRNLFASDPDAIETLFTTEENGLGDALDSMLDDLTRSFDGVIARKDNLLEDREELLNDRIEDLQLLLDRKRARLERQFQGLETSLAGLQDAQNALSILANQVSGLGLLG